MSVYNSHPGQLSLAIPPWVGATATAKGENGEFWLTVTLVTRTAGIIYIFIVAWRWLLGVGFPTTCMGHMLAQLF